MKPLDTLLIEQEAYIDQLFRQTARAITAEVRSPVDRRALDRIVVSEIDKLFGTTTATALISRVGRVVLSYAQSALVETAKRALALWIRALGPLEVSSRIELGRDNDARIRRALALLTPALIVESARVPDGPNKLITRYDALLAGVPNPLRDNLDLLVDLHPVGAPVMQYVVTTGIPTASPDAIQQAQTLFWSSPGLLASAIATTMIPLPIDDTARWLDSANQTLADRLNRSGHLVTDRVQRTISTSTARNDTSASLKASLTTYLTANYRPDRTGKHLAESESPGGVARIGKGQASWPARLIARNELNRQSATGATQAAAANPQAPCLRWELNPAHVRPDDCDANAAHSSPDCAPGVYFANDIPHFPSHPGCLCHLVQCDQQGR